MAERRRQSGEISMRNRQRGQALVFGLFVVFVGAMALFFQFSTGQVSADKQRVTNTADAAAYSAALWRARILNYDAYSNRAMIANEVAIAQTLTLLSETQYLKNLAACLALQTGEGGYQCNAAMSYVMAIIPYATAALSYAQAALQYYEEYLLRNVASAEIGVRSQLINRGLSASQDILHLTTNFLSVQSLVARQVTTINDNNFRVSVVPDNFSGMPGQDFTRRYSGNQRDRLANVVRASLDPYSRDRRLDYGIGLCVRGVGGLKMRYQKRGGTDLAPDLERWEATDNKSEWVVTGKRCRGTENPMSWASHSASGGPISANPGGTNDNPRARRISRDDGVNFDHSETTGVDSYAGIQSFRDLNYAALRGSDAQVRNPMHRLALVVSQPNNVLRTANTLNVGVGRMRMTENTNRDRIATIAAAEVYFERPARRSDGRVELPSLFNPYWQARLAEPSIAQRAVAEAL
jgi:Putative Flp pilus-assembly TadE/G-like